MLAPVLVSPPAVPPISVDDVKRNSNIEHSEHDALIEGFIAAATQHLDGYSGILGQALITQTWRQDFCGFAEPLRLALRPVRSVSVSYFDADNAAQTLSGGIYARWADALGSYLELVPLASWPATYGRRDAVSVTYVAGWGDAPADVPAPIRQAMLLLVGHWYAHREAVVTGTIATALPFAVDALIQPLRRIGF
ncbi:head-tail connector protein [soil metagenome]